jgi:hypothetical protein
MDELTLSPLNLQKLSRYSLEMELLEQKITVQRLLKDMLLAKVDPHGALAKLEMKIQEMTVGYHKARAKYQDVRTDVGNDTGVDLSKYSYDDESGILHAMPEELGSTQT